MKSIIIIYKRVNTHNNFYQYIFAVSIFCNVVFFICKSYCNNFPTSGYINLLDNEMEKY